MNHFILFHACGTGIDRALGRMINYAHISAVPDYKLKIGIIRTSIIVLKMQVHGINSFLRVAMLHDISCILEVCVHEPRAISEIPVEGYEIIAPILSMSFECYRMRGKNLAHGEVPVPCVVMTASTMPRMGM